VALPKMPVALPIAGEQCATGGITKNAGGITKNAGGITKSAGGITGTLFVIGIVLSAYEAQYVKNVR